MSSSCIVTRTCDSPCGKLVLGCYEGRLCLCDWLVKNRRHHVGERLQQRLLARVEDGDTPLLRLAEGQLHEYFAGQRRQLSVPLLFIGSAFQKKVWQGLLDIPYGTTISYGELARRLGMPTAARAVAQANGANVLSLFVPCHRVIGSRLSLTGYNGGLATKRFLLRLEKAWPDCAQGTGFLNSE